MKKFLFILIMLHQSNVFSWEVGTAIDDGRDIKFSIGSLYQSLNVQLIHFLKDKGFDKEFGNPFLCALIEGPLEDFMIKKQNNLTDIDRKVEIFCCTNPLTSSAAFIWIDEIKQIVRGSLCKSSQ